MPINHIDRVKELYGKKGVISDIKADTTPPFDKDEKEKETMAHRFNYHSSERSELRGQLVDIVEDWLESKGITRDQIPNSDRDKDIKDGNDSAALIYGEDFDYLANSFEDVLKNHNLIDLEEDDDDIVVNVEMTLNLKDKNVQDILQLAKDNPKIMQRIEMKPLPAAFPVNPKNWDITKKE